MFRIRLFSFFKKFWLGLVSPLILQSCPPPPSTSCVCLGLLIDTVKETISVPEKKISDILDRCTWALSQKFLSKNNLQSLIGSLMFYTGVLDLLGFSPIAYLPLLET